MHSTKEILSEAYQRGHAWGPQFPNLHNLDPDSVKKMDGSEADAKQLIEAFQRSDANYNVLVQAFHQRLEPNFDGEVGPATETLMGIPRCPMPDFAPPPHAKFFYANPELQRAVESMQRWEATGSGSWPASGCDPDRQGVHSFRVRINTAGAPAGVVAYMKESLQACVEAYADVGVAVRYILDANSPAEIVKHFESMSGGVIGWNYFPQANTCSRITGAFNKTYVPSMKTWAELEMHETGHGVGLPHTNGGVMNPSINPNVPWPLTWRGDPSFNRLKGYFGGEPLTPVTPPGPPVREYAIRFHRAFPAGKHADFTLGSAVGAKDYRVEPLGDEMTPPVPSS